jgi:hypothetical protein
MANAMMVPNANMYIGNPTPEGIGSLDANMFIILVNNGFSQYLDEFQPFQLAET